MEFWNRGKKLNHFIVTWTCSNWRGDGPKELVVNGKVEGPIGEAAARLGQLDIKDDTILIIAFPVIDGGALDLRQPDEIQAWASEWQRKHKVIFELWRGMEAYPRMVGEGEYYFGSHLSVLDAARQSDYIALVRFLDLGISSPERMGAVQVQDAIVRIGADLKGGLTLEEDAHLSFSLRTKEKTPETLPKRDKCYVLFMVKDTDKGLRAIKVLDGDVYECVEAILALLAEKR